MFLQYISPLLSGIHSEIKVTHLQINEKNNPGQKYREIFSPAHLGVMFLQGRRPHKLASAPDVGVCF